MPSLRAALAALDAHRLLARGLADAARWRGRMRPMRRTPLLFVSQVAWDTVWQRPQEESIGLSRYRPVIFLGPVQVHEYATRLRGRWEQFRLLEGGRLLVASPIIFSGEYRSAAVRAANRALLLRFARRLVEPGEFHYFTNSPFFPELPEQLEPARTFYDIIDDFCAFDWAPPDGIEREDRLVLRCDRGFAGTGFLREKFASALPGIEFLPSGVQFDRLSAPAPEPAELRPLPHPRVLYIGTLNDRLDGDLLGAAADAVPNGCVVAVGPRHAAFREPAPRANLHYLGLKPHEALPGFYQHCDLGIMPFADNAAARAINPIKTLEYLACGLPVLSTPIPDVVRYYPEVVRTALPEAWPSAMAELLESHGEAERERARAFARGRSWDALVRAIERSIRECEAGA